MEIEHIRARLKAAGRTQTQLAAHLGIGKGHLSELLNGKLSMRLDMFRRIEAFLESTGLENNGPSATPGVGETTASYSAAQPNAMSPQELEIWLREIAELGAVLRNAPRVSDLTDDELLGYDAMP